MDEQEFEERRQASLTALKIAESTAIKPIPVAQQSQYQEYLKSEAWAVRRKMALAHADGRCQLCGSPKALQVHHRTYENLYNETLHDLTVLCDPCHGNHHGKGAK